MPAFMFPWAAAKAGVQGAIWLVSCALRPSRLREASIHGAGLARLHLLFICEFLASLSLRLSVYLRVLGF